MLIIDASVAFKWFDKNEENFEEAKKILKEHLLGKEEISVPDLFFYELTNAWVTKSALKANEIKKNLEKIKEYSLTIIPVNYVTLEKTINFAKKYAVSVYDAMYAMIALERKCTLVTADDRFVKQTNQKYITKISNLSAQQ